MKTIQKFVVKHGDDDVEMPKNAMILDVQCQIETGFCLWALVDPKEEKKERREFLIYDTGHDIKDSDNLMYLGTTQDLPFVWHIFEKLVP